VCKRHGFDELRGGTAFGGDPAAFAEIMAKSTPGDAPAFSTAA